jgi:adenylate cyclase
MKKILIAIIALTIGVGLKLYDPSIVEIARLKGFDQLLTLSANKFSETAVIIEIDESTIEEYGQWPWPRNLIADGIVKAKNSGAEIIVLYPLLAEPDRFGKDEELKTAIRDAKVIGTQSASLKGKGELASRGFAIVGTTEEQWFYRYQAGIGSIPEVFKNTQGMGMTTTVPEIDGVTRKIPLMLMIGDKFYPSLPLEIARVIHGARNYRGKVTEAGLSNIFINRNFSVEPDKRGELWIDWSWMWPIKSWKDSDWGDLSGKIVVLAVNAEGITNTVATPAGTKLGHEVSLAAWETLWNDDKITRPYWLDLTELGFFVCLILISAIIADRCNKTIVGIWSIIILTIPFTISYYNFTQYQYLVDWTFNTILGFLFYGYLVYNRFIKEFRLKQQIKKQFQSYLSKDLVEKLQKNPELLKLGGDSRELSIMFTDVRGFTSISEHYGENVQGLTNIMNRYMTAMTAKILDNSGTLDKYIGDAQMAFWNAPLDDKQHAKNAVKTALSMLGDLDDFNRKISAEGVPPFGMGLGINTGVVVVGNMGSDQRFDYTCLGDSVNLASRLEGQSKPYGVKIVIGPKTAEYIADEYFVLELDTIAVKGKKQGVNIYTVLGLNSTIQDTFKNDHNKMLALYRQANFKASIKVAKELQKSAHKDMSAYYEMMIERCEDYVKNPPPKDWDGIYRATSK